MSDNIGKSLDEREEKNALLKGFFESNYVYMCIFEDAGTDFIYRLPNKCMAEYFNYTVEEFTGKSGREIGISESIIQEWLDIFSHCRDTGESINREFFLTFGGKTRWHQGTVSPIRIDDGPIRFFSLTATDITEHKRIEQMLRESEEKSRDLIRYAPASIYEMDINGTRFKSVNDVTCQYLGYTREELLTINPFDLMDDQSKIIFQERIRKKLAGEEVDNSVEYKVKAKNGREIYTIVNVGNFIYKDGKPESVKDGKPESVLVIAHDITERKKMEESLRKSEERYRILTDELREADRHKNDFLAVLSHELRNPLASIHNCLHILDQTIPGGVQAKRAKEVIDRQVGQLSHLVDDLLDITRITQNKIKLQWRRVELNELVRRTVEDHRPLFEKNRVSLEVEYTSAKVFVNADEARLIQVVGNLLFNAVKFTNCGGNTRVYVKNDNSLQRAIIRIVDTGVGMTPETISRLFQPFMQADITLERSRGGLGLGLALAKGLIEIHGGELSVYSAGIGQGSEFIVSLPLEDTLTEEQSAISLEIPTSHQSRKVLIIDDNVDLARSLRDLLEIYEHEVTVAYSGPEGLIKARESQPEILLCDIGLPEMDGYAVARAFHRDEALKNVFLIAMTGYVLPHDKQRAMEAGFKLHLAKPVELAALERVLAQVPSDVNSKKRGNLS